MNFAKRRDPERNMKTKKKKHRGIFSTLYLTLMTTVSYLPVFVVVFYSFNESKISSVWGGFSLKWYEKLFADEAMFKALGTTVLLGAASALIAAVIAVMAALGIKNAKLPFLGAVEYISSLPIMIPEIVLGMVFLMYFTLFGMELGFGTLLIGHISFSIPYIYMQVKARLIGLDETYLDAARDLGASPVRAFFDVTLPLIMPALISGMFLAFAMSFDDVIISVFLSGVGNATLPVKVYTQIKTGTTPEINALCTVMLAVTLLCYAISLAFSLRGTGNRKKEKEKEPENK